MARDLKVRFTDSTWKMLLSSSTCVNPVFVRYINPAGIPPFQPHVVTNKSDAERVPPWELIEVHRTKIACRLQFRLLTCRFIYSRMVHNVMAWHAPRVLEHIVTDNTNEGIGHTTCRARWEKNLRSASENHQVPCMMTVLATKYDFAP